jgi:mono/diheme cytochrome c family protein
LKEKEPDGRARAIRLLSLFELIGAAAFTLGFFLWERALPQAVRDLFLGAKPLVASLGSTRSFVLAAAAAGAVLALLFLVLPRLQNPLTAVAALLAGFALLGGYERLREGARKPFVIRDVMFSNGILVSEVATLNSNGVLTKAAWAARDVKPGDPLTLGRAVFHAECVSCHTLDGYLGIRKISAGADADMLRGILTVMRDDGPKYASHPPSPKPDYPFMAPFAGTDAELEALALYVDSLKTPIEAEVRSAR